MRLGDLDALYDCVEARYRLSSGEEHKAERALLDAICGSPTIPAIPVEWLEERRQDMEDAEQDFPAQAIRYVLWLWKAAKGR